MGPLNDLETSNAMYHFPKDNLQEILLAPSTQAGIS